MFRRDARLRCKAQFDLVRGEGQSSAARTCVVNMLKAPPDQQKRAAFSISKRYSPLAVVRNRARRLFREVYRKIYGEIPVSWLIFVPRRKMQGAKMQEVLEDVISCLRNLGVAISEGRGDGE